MDINAAWKSTCRILLGDEVGGMLEFEDYLKGYVDPVSKRKSSISGKETAIPSENLCKGARIISHDEMPEYEKRTAALKLDINDLKDIDSIVEAAQERAYYCGNIALGNSGNVERSNRCINAFHVYESQDVYDSKYIAYSCTLRYSECIFGSNGIGETKFAIKNFETYQDSRCVETVRTYTSSGCYFTANVEASSNCMFTFNVRNKNWMIGNNQFSIEEYGKLKEKLLEDMRETLRDKKGMPSILDIIRD
jgi:hypothetical protein